MHCAASNTNRVEAADGERADGRAVDQADRSDGPKSSPLDNGDFCIDGKQNQDDGKHSSDQRPKPDPRISKLRGRVALVCLPHYILSGLLLIWTTWTPLLAATVSYCCRLLFPATHSSSSH